MLVLAYDTITNLRAEDELIMSHAHAYGAALAYGDKKEMHKLRRHVRKLTAAAHPQVEVPANGT